MIGDVGKGQLPMMDIIK
jgi:hypothetical protein